MCDIAQRKIFLLLSTVPQMILLQYSDNSQRYDKSTKILLYYWNISARPKCSYLTIAWATPNAISIKIFLQSFRKLFMIGYFKGHLDIHMDEITE